MAKAKVGKKITGIAIELLKCPVCLDTMSAPTYQCQSGHSLCNSCTKSLCPPIFPICRGDMTQMRNWQLEEIIAKANVPCPNKSLGCIYTMLSEEVDDHLKECIYRDMVCPLGAVLGKCSWTGQLKQMMQHFKERHPQNCNINPDTDVELKNVSINEDERFMYLVSQGKYLFVVTIKIDALQKYVYWVVQHIGSKKTAWQHIYEIHITSKQDSRRKVTFADHCFNDALPADDIYRQGKCGIMPLGMFSHFILNNTCSFKFLVKKSAFGPKHKFEKINNTNENKQQNKFNKGPKPNSSSNPRNKSPGPGQAFKASFNSKKT